MIAFSCKYPWITPIFTVISGTKISTKFTQKVSFQVSQLSFSRVVQYFVVLFYYVPAFLFRLRLARLPALSSGPFLIKPPLR